MCILLVRLSCTNKHQLLVRWGKQRYFHIQSHFTLCVSTSRGTILCVLYFWHCMHHFRTLVHLVWKVTQVLLPLFLDVPASIWILFMVFEHYFQVPRPLCIIIRVLHVDTIAAHLLFAKTNPAQSVLPHFFRFVDAHWSCHQSVAIWPHTVCFLRCTESPLLHHKSAFLLVAIEAIILKRQVVESLWFYATLMKPFVSNKYIVSSILVHMHMIISWFAVPVRGVH